MDFFNVKKLTPSVERRAVAERRQDAEPSTDGERRKGADRRGMRFGVLFRTTRSIDDIEDWLEGNCGDSWSISLEGIEEDLSSKTLRVLFMSEADKIAFSRALGDRA